MGVWAGGRAEYVDKMRETLEKYKQGDAFTGPNQLWRVSMNYSQNELMIAAAARELQGARVAFVGVGLPNIVCNLAQRSHSPDLELVYEAGVFGSARLPLSIGDPTIVTGCGVRDGHVELFQFYLQRGAD